MSQLTWCICKDLDWKDRKSQGDQFLRAVDSVGANVAEGFGRFHYLDKVRFYFNARGSLLEARHWLDLLQERQLIKKELVNNFIELYRNLRPALNGLIESTLKAKSKK